jgi:tripartite-type tricarboxylate transporter receptor subunit TctC
MSMGIARAPAQRGQPHGSEGESQMQLKAAVAILAASVALITPCVGSAQWKPTKPVELVVTSTPGGGTDVHARTIQSIIEKYKLLDKPVTVVNKGGGSGAEAFVYVKSLAGDPHHILFGNSNAWQQPLVSRVAFRYQDFTPLAVMALDEFMLWVQYDAPYRSVKDYLQAASTRELKMGGGYAKDTDEVLTRLIAKTANVKLLYVPFKSGNEAAVQLAGKHIDSNTNNPGESLAQWKGKTQRPLCVFSPIRMPEGPKVTDTMSWHDVPTCVSEGLNIPKYQQPRTLMLAGGVTAEQTAFYVDLLRRVEQTPEWKAYITRTIQTNALITGDDLRKFIVDDEARLRQIAADNGWLVN